MLIAKKPHFWCFIAHVIRHVFNWMFLHLFLTLSYSHLCHSAFYGTQKLLSPSISFLFTCSQTPFQYDALNGKQFITRETMMETSQDAFSFCMRIELVFKDKMLPSAGILLIAYRCHYWYQLSRMKHHNNVQFIV